MTRKTGVMLHFQARSVVGGVFIKALADKKSQGQVEKVQPIEGGWPALFLVSGKAVAGAEARFFFYPLRPD